MQLNLAFLDIPNPSAPLWEQLDAEQRIAALDVLARLIAQAAQNELSREESDDD